MSELSKYQYLKLAAIAVNAYEVKFDDQRKLAEQIFGLAEYLKSIDMNSTSNSVVVKNPND